MSLIKRLFGRKKEETDMECIRQSVNIDNDILYAVGVSTIGRSHQIEDGICQDFNFAEEVAPGWFLFIVSDGAGSALKSHIGSEQTCLKVREYLVNLLRDKQWPETNYTPSDLEWYIESRAIFSQIKLFFKQMSRSEDYSCNESDFYSTALLLIVTPSAILSAHIGDGRMGYRDTQNTWHSLMWPHKGEEANQTIFIQSNWTYPQTPALKLKDVYVPESQVVRDKPSAVVLMSDGCEMFAWECDVLNQASGIIEHINKPFAGFLDPLLKDIEHTDPKDRISKLNYLLNNANESCQEETDDKSLLIANFKNSCEILGEDK